MALSKYFTCLVPLPNDFKISVSSRKKSGNMYSSSITQRLYHRNNN